MQEQARTVFDGEAEGERRMLRGTALAFHHAPDEWRAHATAALRECARRKAFITSDDVRELIPHGLMQPHPNAYGGLWQWAIAAGLVERTEQTARSTRPEARARRLGVWRSRIFTEAAS